MTGRHLAALLFLLTTACGSSPSEHVREVLCTAHGDPVNFCNATCVTQRTSGACMDQWQTVSMYASSMEACLRGCTSSEVCAGTQYYDCNCYADCVAQQSPHLQQALLDANVCDIPTECR